MNKEVEIYISKLLDCYVIVLRAQLKDLGYQCQQFSTIEFFHHTNRSCKAWSELDLNCVAVTRALESGSNLISDFLHSNSIDAVTNLFSLFERFIILACFRFKLLRLAHVVVVAYFFTKLLFSLQLGVGYSHVFFILQNT